jgi:purine-binding chemotaxis protein CheW
MDLLDIRKKAKEAKAAKEAEAKGTSVPEPEAPSVPEPAPVKETAVKRVKRRHVKAASRVVSIAEAAPAVKAADRLSSPDAHAEDGVLSSSEPPATQGVPGGEGHKEAEISAVPAPEEAAPAQENAVSETAEAHDEEEMSAAAAQAVESSGKAELLAFMLGDEEYALKMEEAREIIRWRKPAKVPRAPEYIIGIISLRGVILPVFDVKKRLGLGELNPSRHTRIIVVSEGGSFSGMVVDRITGVTAVQVKEIESAPAVIDGNEAEYIEGVGRAGERLLILIRASRALSA